MYDQLLGRLLWLQRWPWEEKGTKSSSSPITVYRRSTSTVNDTGSLGFFETKLTDIDGDNLTFNSYHKYILSTEYFYHHHHDYHAGLWRH